MADFKKILGTTLKNEGLYSNDPDDSGGETFLGISRNNHPDWKGWKVVDNAKSEPDFPKALIQNDELGIAVEDFYYQNFYKPTGCDRIVNDEKAGMVFDFSVNAGTHEAIEAAQKASAVTVDGIIGNITINAINNCYLETFIPRMKCAKIDYYVKVVEKKPEKKKYFFGWVKRAMK